MVATLGSEVMPQVDFFARNADSMGILTNVPDNTWKIGASREQEAPLHWFEPDSYYSNVGQFDLIPHQYTQALQQFGQATLTKNGLAPWRILQTYDLLVSALKKRDFATALQMAGVMSHYVGDLSQPLHVTKNYDGQESGQKGLHSYFESQNLSLHGLSEEQAKVQEGARALLAKPKFVSQFEGPITDVVFRELLRAYARVAEILDNDKKFGRKGQGAELQYQIALERLSDGAASLALILNRAWIEAGLERGEGSSLHVPTPQFLAPHFYDDNRAPIVVSLKNAAAMALEDDCGQP